jgi:hypothetical protein
VISNEVIDDGTPLSLRKRLDVDEDLGITPVGRDEAESFIVLPGGDPALMANPGHRRVNGGANSIDSIED